MILAPIKFKQGYKISREDAVTYTVRCPKCPTYTVTVTDYLKAVTIMNDHAQVAHEDFNIDNNEEMMLRSRNGLQ